MGKPGLRRLEPIAAGTPPPSYVTRGRNQPT
jgi:hypothetical protein